MSDIDDEDDALLGIDPEQDPVVTATGTSQTLELHAQRLAHTVGMLREWTGDELDHRVGYPAR